MKLLTKALIKRFAEVGRQTGDDAIVICKFFGGSSASWYATEFDGEDTFFGYVVGLGHNELGYFSLAELQAARFPPFGLPTEREIRWHECSLAEVKEREP